MIQKAEAPKRRTQSERSASSRAQILQSAITCLASYGYSATTMNLIAKTAKMSTGRMQHQFATKVQIMAAVVEFVYQENTNLLSPEKLKAQDPLDRMREYIHVLREVFEQDFVLATFEIRMATRSDPELADAVAPLIKSFDARSFKELESLLADAGMASKDTYAWMRLMIAVVRGLALERVLHYQTTREPNTEVMLNMLLDQLVASDRNTERRDKKAKPAISSRA